MKRANEENISIDRKKVEAEYPPEMGEFEDRWDDDLESEEEIVENENSDSDIEGELEEMDMDDEELKKKMENLQVYLPGGQMENDEELIADQSTYDMLHAMNVEWPCLSFDILQDKLGNDRKSFPMTTYIVAGSQAESYQDNKVYVMKMSSLQKTKHDDGDSSDEDDDNDGDDDPVLEYKMIAHEGGVNRVRVLNIN